MIGGLKEYNQLVYTPSDINEHLPTLCKYAEKCDVVVELGVRYIVSSWAFVVAKPKKLISVDIVNPDTHPDSRGYRVHHLQSACSENGTEFEFILGDSRKIDLPEHDLLFIDTLHNYEVLKEELRVQAPKTRKFIAFHDTTLFGYRDEQGQGPGLIKAIQEFLASNPNWSIEEVYNNNNGLTILAKS